jgi:hypothetical protein
VELLGQVLTPLIWISQILIGYQQQYPLFGVAIASLVTILVITVYVRGMQGRLKGEESYLSLPVPFLLAIHIISVPGLLVARSGFNTGSYEFNFGVGIIIGTFILGGIFTVSNKDSEAVASTISCAALCFGLIGVSVSAILT